MRQANWMYPFTEPIQRYRQTNWILVTLSCWRRTRKRDSQSRFPCSAVSRIVASDIIGRLSTYSQDRSRRVKQHSDFDGFERQTNSLATTVVWIRFQCLPPHLKHTARIWQPIEPSVQWNRSGVYRSRYTCTALHPLELLENENANVSFMHEDDVN